MSRSTIPDLIEVSRRLKRNLPAGYRALLFGSRATGQARPGSDWDIGILGPTALRGAVVQSIRDELDDLPTLHTFDVVDLATVPDSFRQMALKNVVRLV